MYFNSQDLIKLSQCLKENVRDLERALELMLSVPSRAYDNRFITSIEGYRGNIGKLGRLLLHEWVTFTDKDEKNHDRYCFLFKSRILVTKVRKISEKKSIFILQNIIKLPQCNIEVRANENQIFFSSKAIDEKSNFPILIKPHNEENHLTWYNEIVQYMNHEVTLQEHNADDLKLDPTNVATENELLLRLPQKIEAHDSNLGTRPSDVAENYFLSKETKERLQQEHQELLKFEKESIELFKSQQNLTQTKDQVIEVSDNIAHIPLQQNLKGETRSNLLSSSSENKSIESAETTLVVDKIKPAQEPGPSNTSSVVLPTQIDCEAQLLGTTLKKEFSIKETLDENTSAKETQLIGLSNASILEGKEEESLPTYEPRDLIPKIELSNPTDAQHFIKSKHKPIELTHIVGYNESLQDSDRVTTNSQSRSGFANYTNITDSASLTQWNNALANIRYSNGDNHSAQDAPPPPIPPHFVRMPGFFQPLPLIAYETTIEILVIKSRPPSPPPRMPTIKRVLVHTESLEQKTQNFLEGIYDVSTTDTSLRNAKQKIRNIKNTVLKSTDTTKYAQDTVQKAKARDFIHIFTPPIKKKRPIYEIIEEPVNISVVEGEYTESIADDFRESSAEFETRGHSVGGMDDNYSGYSMASRRRLESKFP